MKRSRSKDLQTGVPKGIATLGCKEELDTEVVERSCETQLQKDDKAARDDEAGNAVNNLF